MSTPPKVFVAGHRGMVGSAIVRQLLAQDHPAASIVTRTHAELDLCKFDYTQWRQTGLPSMSLQDMALQAKQLSAQLDRAAQY